MRVTGDKELVRALRALGRGLPSSSIDRSVKYAAKPMLDDVIMRAKTHRQARRPKGGHLDEGIVFRKTREQRRNRRSFVLGATGRARKIAHLVEFYVRPHWQPRRFGGIMHPGHPGYPMFRPAFDAHADKTVIRFGHEIWQEVERLVYRLNRGGRSK